MVWLIIGTSAFAAAVGMAVYCYSDSIAARTAKKRQSGKKGPLAREEDQARVQVREGAAHLMISAGFVLFAAITYALLTGYLLPPIE